MHILTQVLNEMSIFLTFHEKVYLILTNLGKTKNFGAFPKNRTDIPALVETELEGIMASINLTFFIWVREGFKKKKNMENSI